MKFEKDQRYRMPVFFGAMLGPRQFPERYVDPTNSPRRVVASWTQQVDGARLKSLLPEGFSTWGAPRIIMEIQSLTEVSWLAGRGYNTFGVKVPVTFNARHREMHGNLLLILWEDQADPIITGREELGFSKVFCDISGIEANQDKISVSASWFDFEFFRLDAKFEDGANSLEQNNDNGKAPEGVFHYKYFPKTNVLGEAAVSEVTFTPAADPYTRLISRRSGSGSYEFRQSRWEDLPTLHHIVEFFVSLGVSGDAEITLTETRGGKNLNDTVSLSR